MPWGGDSRQYTHMDSNNDDFFGEQSQEPASSVPAELEQEWRARETRHRTHGYREGLTAGKNAAVQSGFEQGVRDTVATSFRWGQARGVASAFAALPTPLQHKLIPNPNICKLIQQTDSLFQPLSTLDAARAHAASVSSQSSTNAPHEPAEAGASCSPASLPVEDQTRIEGADSFLAPRAASLVDAVNENILSGSGGSVSEHSSSSLLATEGRVGVTEGITSLGAAIGRLDQQIRNSESGVDHAAAGLSGRGNSEQCGSQGGVMDVGQKCGEGEGRDVGEVLLTGDDLLDERNARQVLVRIEHVQSNLWRGVSLYGVELRGGASGE